ncbi:MAG: carbonic anhydrase [Myxococcales bacterium]|nr:carbonic anhydrase [Myxococcales bacterium]
MNAPEALEKLKQGNARFIANVRGAEPILSQVRRADFVHGQNPFAVVLGCSDSRVPAEIVFDQGLGDLFVIRVAGNIVAPSQVGSVEFAVERFQTPLVVVLGHTFCGGVGATLDVLQGRAKAGSRGLMAIVDRIRPAIEPLLQTDLARDPDALARVATRANVRASANQLRHGSEIIERMVLERGLAVVGGVYELATGEVEFFDGMP